VTAPDVPVWLPHAPCPSPSAAARHPLRPEECPFSAQGAAFLFVHGRSRHRCPDRGYRRRILQIRQLRPQLAPPPSGHPESEADELFGDSRQVERFETGETHDSLYDGRFHLFNWDFRSFGVRDCLLILNRTSI
jgi:hypothetical protein